MVIYLIDMVILDIDMGYGLMILKRNDSIDTVILDIDMGYLVSLGAECQCQNQFQKRL